MKATRLEPSAMRSTGLRCTRMMNGSEPPPVCFLQNNFNMLSQKSLRASAV